MDEDLTFLTAEVADFPGYGSEIERRGSDQRVRAVLGEALATLRAGLNGALDPAARELLDAALLRCQFVDQRYVAAVEDRTIDAADAAKMAHDDRELVAAALGLAALEPAELAARLEQIMTALDRRSEPFD